MLRYFLISCLLCFTANNGVAQTQGYEYADSTLLQEPELSPEMNDNQDSIGIPTNPNTEDTNFTDTILYMHEVAVPPDSIAGWKRDKKYAYLHNLDSLLKAKEKEYISQQRTIGNDSSPASSNKFFSSGIVQGIFWAIAIAFVLFILYNLFLNQGIFKKNRYSLPMKQLAEDEPAIADVSDYDALIHQSFKLADYRMAVRYLFLKMLRQLSDKGQLQPAVDKTNFQYVQEISQARRKDFASLVLKYEYVWYGHLQISREQYGQIEESYVSFYNKI